MSGLQLAEHVAALRPELRVLLISGYASDATDGTAVQRRHSFLQKPFTPHDLLVRVRELLPHARETACQSDERLPMTAPTAASRCASSNGLSMCASNPAAFVRR